jgi:hypothetical protein
MLLYMRVCDANFMRIALVEVMDEVGAHVGRLGGRACSNVWKAT